MSNFTDNDLRSYQAEGVQNFRDLYSDSPAFTVDGKATGVNQIRGRFVYPTGAGKTVVQSVILRDIINETANDIHLVLSPRIVLTNQLMSEYRKIIGSNYLAMAFHSGKTEPDFERVKWTEYSSTSVADVQSEYERARELGKDLVVFSTYHSACKLMGFDFDTLIADESQYTVSEGFFETFKNLSAGVRLSFTACEKHNLYNSQMSQDNVDVFGDIIHSVTPDFLISKGYLVPPRLHIISASAQADNTLIDKVFNIAQYQDEVTRKTMPFSKILFACKGTDDVKTVVEHLSTLKQKMPQHKIFTIVSNAKYGCMVDGVKMARGNFMKELRESDNALIFHYDILSEGIDIDGITGVAILRNMGTSKLLQTIGRALRIYKANPKLKKQALVSVPVIDGNDDGLSMIRDHVVALREGGFDLRYEEIMFSPEANPGIAEDDDLDDQYMLNTRKSVQSVLQNIQNNLEHHEWMLFVKKANTNDLMEMA